MSAIVPANGPIRQLDSAAEPDEQVTDEVTSDAPRLARLLMRALKDIATLKRRWWPRRLDFEDISLDDTGTTKYRLAHHFRGAVRYWPVTWVGVAAPNLVLDDATDSYTLVLTSTSEGVATIRVEEAG